MRISYKGKKYKWSFKKLLKNIFYGIEFITIMAVYSFIFFEMLVHLIER